MQVLGQSGVALSLVSDASTVLSFALSTGAATFSGALNGTTGTFLSGSSSTIGLIVGGAGGSGATRQGQIRFGDAGTVYKIQGGEDYSAMNFMIGSGTPLSIASTGAATFASSVGIGTASPQTTLSIETSGVQSTVSPIITGQSSGTTYGGMYTIRDGAGDQRGLIFQNYTANVGLTEKMRITSAGSVGIGTATPGQKLVLEDASACRFDVIRTGGAAGRVSSTSDTVFMGSTTSHPLVLFTADTERKRITAGGFTKSSNTGGYYSTNGTFHELVSNNASSTIAVMQHRGTDPYGFYMNFLQSPNNTTNYFLQGEDGTNTKFYIYSNGNMVNRNGSYGAISDAKLKENIEDASLKLDDLMKVKVRNYNLIGDDKKQIGVIAQELEEVFPAMIDESEDFEEVEVPQLDEEGNEVLNEEGEVVTTKERVSKGTTTKSVKYSVFVPMLIKAIQEQQEQIQELKTEIDSLKNQIK
jgi:hypothetical protein